MANFPVRTARILRQNCRKCPEEKRNEEILEQNNDGYVNLAYQLGTAYYFAGGGGKPSGDKALASTWLSIVAQSVLDDTELGKLGLEAGTKLSQAKIQEYDINANLVETFLSICNYYGKVGQEDSVTGEIKYSYKDFWNELAGLVDQQPSEISNESNTRLTQLRLLDDIAYQMYSYAAQFASDGGVDKATFQKELAAIKQRVADANTGSNQTAKRIQENTLTTIEKAEQQVDSLYAENSKVLKSGGEQ